MGFFLPSHMDQGVIFGVWGLWHLANTLRSFVKAPRLFNYGTWFPVRLPWTFRCLELWALLLINVLFLCTQLGHAQEDFAAGMIATIHLRRFQHVSFALFFLLYVIVALITENSQRLPLPRGALHGTLALGFAMELLVFHLGHHVQDTLEGFVHFLMQIVVLFLVIFMLMEILWPKNVLVSIARCILLVFKGTWFFHIGLLMNVPFWTPEGCKMSEDADFPECIGEPLMRAKALQVLTLVIQLWLIVVATYCVYASLVGFHVGACKKDHYQYLPNLGEEEDDDDGGIILTDSHSPSKLASEPLKIISVIPRAVLWHPDKL